MDDKKDKCHYLAPEGMLEKLNGYITSRELMIRSWVVEKLEEERRFNRRECDILKGEVSHRIQQTHLSRRSSVDYGWSAHNQRDTAELKDRMGVIEREFTSLLRDRRPEEMDRMAERMAAMEILMAKMAEERIQEREEATKREGARLRAMEEEKVRERKAMEEERARERRDMERRLALMEDERLKDRKEMERMAKLMEELAAERDWMSHRLAGAERVMDDIEVWLRKRDDAVLQRTEAAITQMEDRINQIEEAVVSAGEDCQLKGELQAFLDKRVFDMQREYSCKILETADQLERSFQEMTDRCILNRTRGLFQQEQGDNCQKKPKVDRGHLCRADYAPMPSDDQRRGPRSRRRRDKDEHLPSSSSESWSDSQRSERIRRRRKIERESAREQALEVIRETSSTAETWSTISFSKAGSDGKASRSASDPTVNMEKKEAKEMKETTGTKEKRGFWSKLFKKKKGKA